MQDDVWWDGPKTFVLQSRRFVEYEFNQSLMDRNDYVRNQQMNVHNRSSSIYEFNARLFKMQKNKEHLINCLGKCWGMILSGQ